MSLLSFCINHELKFFLDIIDTNVESSEPIQPDITGASSVVPPLQAKATAEKVFVYTKIWKEECENSKLPRPCHQGVDCIKVGIN